MIWRAHTFGPTGLPIPPQAPPALRVEGGVEATVQQRAMAQVVFAQFCMTARVSLGPNPTQAGLLPDGTPYKITTVGPQTIMQIWPVSGEEDRLGGIAITLVYLDGSVVPGHHTDGVPTLYLLTPRSQRKGSRVSNGQWRVRKPNALIGGKVVHGGPDGRKTFVGIDGAGLLSIPYSRTGGINYMGYGENTAGENVKAYRENKEIALSRFNPLPFRYATPAAQHSMQIIIRSETGPSRQFWDLYVGPVATAATEYVGELVATLETPINDIVISRSITFKADGTEARVTSSGSSGYTYKTVHISPTGLNITTDRTMPFDRTVGTAWNRSFKTETTGSPATVGYEEKRWDVYGAGDGSAAYQSVRPYESATDPGMSQFNGDVTYQRYGIGSYCFDRRGRPFGNDFSKVSGTARGKSEEYNRFHIYAQEGLTLYFTEEKSVNEFGFNTKDGTVTRDHADNYTYTATKYNDGLNTHTISESIEGGGHTYSNSGTMSGMVFEDEELDFRAYYETQSVTSRTWSWEMTGAGTYGPVETSNTTTNTLIFKVRCKGATLMEMTIVNGPDEPDNGFAMKALVASDPYTGALVVNLLDLRTATQAIRRSWLFAVDDTGAKPLGRVLGFPEDSTNIKATSNAELFSV